MELRYKLTKSKKDLINIQKLTINAFFGVILDI